MINDVAVEIKQNTNDTENGLHLALVNPTNGKVELAQAFDTF